ncbi:MAG: CoA-transferase [Betaproteobacteria bacterium RIFCSPLOWO2_02_FULL_62_17]|nr:MAG: CoA-transferase [Betaproteobacteria bacterium RIFCSPLOWO2_02_FULL_62_17]
MSGALSHIRILDLGRILAGPTCSQTLADLGAEVIKIERPGAGDDTRSWAPPYLKDEQGRDTSEAAYYLSCNRGKQSVTLDISRPEGQEVFRALAEKSDVLIENFKVGDLARFGLDYASLKALNPRLIYCSITGFGQTGPYAKRAGYDFLIQGMGGLMSITGERDELPGGGPQKVGVAVTDLMTGMYAAIAILAALAYRERSGKGQYIDMALLDVGVSMLSNMHLNYFTTNEVPKRWGNAHPNIVPYQVFACSDGHMILAAGNDSQFQKFCEVAACTDLPADPRFAGNDGRVRHRDTLVPMLAGIIRKRARDDWVASLEAAGVPCGPINNLDQVFADPQVQYRGMKFELPHPSAGTVPLVASPMRLSETPVQYRRAPPLLGQDTEAVLAKVLGMDDAKIADLRNQKII